MNRRLYKLGLWIYCTTSGRAAYWWPTKYGRPFGSWLMATMVKRAKLNKRKTDEPN